MLMVACDVDDTAKALGIDRKHVSSSMRCIAKTFREMLTEAFGCWKQVCELKRLIATYYVRKFDGAKKVVSMPALTVSGVQVKGQQSEIIVQIMQSKRLLMIC